LQVGEGLLTDIEMIETAKKHLTKSKLAVYNLPGFSTINKNLKPALQAGVDVVCVGSHCTEIDITRRHIEYVKERSKMSISCLMMTHMVSKEVLAEECYKSQTYGSDGIILMDSAGSYFSSDVSEKISYLIKSLKIPVGFHAHNNLGLAVSNSIQAVKSGATIIDGCSRGFGAGAGNSQLEIIIAILNKLGYDTGVDLYKMLDAADIIEEEFNQKMSCIKSTSIISGLAGVFSGFITHVDRISKQYGVDARDVFFELGKRKAVAGQEDLIIDVARTLIGKINK
jgi:4-hydroxy 2-oxovalerate aldolase